MMDGSKPETDRRDMGQGYIARPLKDIQNLDENHSIFSCLLVGDME